MAELREYTVTVNGVETVMNLSEADAQRLGVTSAPNTEEKQRASAATKSRTVRNKAGDDE